MPMASGVPICTGAPCTRGMPAVMATAAGTCAWGIGRILTTIFPLNTPAGVQGMLVLYIGTLTPSSIWRTGMSASSSADSKEKLHPMRKLTKSDRSSK